MAGEQYNPYGQPNYGNQSYYPPQSYMPPNPWDERERRLREYEHNMSRFGQITPPPPPPPPAHPTQYGTAQSTNVPPQQTEQPTTRGYAAIPVASVEQAKDFTIPPDQLQMKFILPQNVDMQDGKIYVKYVDPNTYEPIFKEFIAVGAAASAAQQPQNQTNNMTPSVASPNATAPYTAESPQEQQQGDSAKYLTDDDIQPLRCEISGIVAMMDKMSANIEKMCAQIEDLEGFFDESGLDNDNEQPTGAGVSQDKPGGEQQAGKNPADSKPKSK